MLALVEGLKNMKYFTLGCHDLTVGTDHKPLLGMLKDDWLPPPQIPYQETS